MKNESAMTEKIDKRRIKRKSTSTRTKEENNRIVEENLALVGLFLRKLNVEPDITSPLGYWDMFQAGCIGLMEAVESWDETKCRLSTYANLYIKGAICHEIAKNGRSIRIPAGWNWNSRGLKNKKRAEDMKHRVSEVWSLEKVERQNECLEKWENEDNHEMIKNVSGVCYIETLRLRQSTEDSVLEQELREKIKEVLDTLDESSREIIKMYYGFYGKRMSSRDIARRMNLDKSEVQKIKARGLYKLQEAPVKRMLAGLT